MEKFLQSSSHEEAFWFYHMYMGRHTNMAMSAGTNDGKTPYQESNNLSDDIYVMLL